LAVVTTARAPSVDDTPAAGCRLVWSSEGWTLEAFECSTPIRPLGLPVEELGALDELLSEADREMDAPDTPDEEPLAASPTELTTDHAIVVGLMGPLAVTDREGVSGSFERSKTV
jgi:hypothetical protein